MPKSTTYSVVTVLGLIVVVVAIAFLWRSGVFGTIASSSRSQAAAAAGAFPPADNFAVLASTYGNSGATTITGDLGYTTGPGVAPTILSGTTHVGVADSAYTQGGTHQASILGALNAQSCDFVFGSATDLSLQPQPLVPGVYCIGAAASIGTGGITLTGSGTYTDRKSVV